MDKSAIKKMSTTIPFTGTTTTEIVSLSRAEPPAIHFKVPDDDTVKPFIMGGVNLGTLGN